MTTIEARIRFQTENEQQAERAFKSLSRAQRDLIDEFRLGNRSYDQSAQALRDLGDDAERTERALASLRNEQQALNRTALNESRFDRTSRDVALAGDVQSNLGAISGLAGAAGAGGLGQGIGIAGELVVLTEELPRLKEAVRGLPDATNAAGKALGLGGGAGLIGALGLTAVAVGAVKIAFDNVKASIQPVADVLNARIQAELDVNAQLATLTSEQIDQRQRQLDIQREADAQTLAQLEGALGDVRGTFGVFAGFISKIFGVDLKGQIKEAEGRIASAEAEADELEQARSNSIVKANDARQKEQQSLASLVSETESATDSIEKLERAAGGLGSASQTATRNIQNRSPRKTAQQRAAERGNTAGFTIAGFGAIARGNRNANTSPAVATARAGNEDLQRAYEERRQLTERYNEDVTRLTRDSQRQQIEDLERFLFDQQRSLRGGNFGQAFDAREQFNFSQQQEGRRVEQQFADLREDWIQATTQLATEVRNSLTQGLDVRVQAERGFSAQASMSQQRTIRFGSSR